jgi:hypothetical protein
VAGRSWQKLTPPLEAGGIARFMIFVGPISSIFDYAEAFKVRKDDMMALRYQLLHRTLAAACGFRRLRPGIPIERGHAFRSRRWPPVPTKAAGVLLPA